MKRMTKEKISESDYTYDAKFKQLFTNRVFLTPILKNIIPEYKECALEEIETLIQPHGDTKVNPQAYNSQYNPYHIYSSKVKEEVDEMMTIRESFEARGEARGELKGVIWFMLEENRSDAEIIKCLSTRKRNPLTEEQARKALDDYRRENL